MSAKILIVNTKNTSCFSRNEFQPDQVQSAWFTGALIFPDHSFWWKWHSDLLKIVHFLGTVHFELGSSKRELKTVQSSDSELETSRSNNRRAAETKYNKNSPPKFDIVSNATVISSISNLFVHFDEVPSCLFLITSSWIQIRYFDKN